MRLENTHMGVLNVFVFAVCVLLFITQIKPILDGMKCVEYKDHWTGIGKTSKCKTWAPK